MELEVSWKGSGGPGGPWKGGAWGRGSGSPLGPPWAVCGAVRRLPGQKFCRRNRRKSVYKIDEKRCTKSTKKRYTKWTNSVREIDKILSTKWSPKCRVRKVKTNETLLIRRGSPPGPPRTPHGGPKTPPKTPTTPPNGPKTPPKRPKTPPRGPKAPPGRLRGASGTPPGPPGRFREPSKSGFPPGKYF